MSKSKSSHLGWRKILVPTTSKLNLQNNKLLRGKVWNSVSCMWRFPLRMHGWSDIILRVRTCDIQSPAMKQERRVFVFLWEFMFCSLWLKILLQRLRKLLANKLLLVNFPSLYKISCVRVIYYLWVEKTFRPTNLPSHHLGWWRSRNC